MRISIQSTLESTAVLHGFLQRVRLRLSAFCFRGSCTATLASCSLNRIIYSDSGIRGAQAPGSARRATTRTTAPAANDCGRGSAKHPQYYNSMPGLLLNASPAERAFSASHGAWALELARFPHHCIYPLQHGGGYMRAQHRATALFAQNVALPQLQVASVAQRAAAHRRQLQAQHTGRTRLSGTRVAY